MATATRPASVEANPKSARGRLEYIDTIRIGLTLLVVLHHMAMNYGAGGPFYYVEFDPDGVSKLLIIFVLVNQSWFMGAFFLLAGYFTPSSYDRRGTSGFLRSRVLRLGLPLVFYMLVLNPIAVMGAFFLADELYPLTWDAYTYPDYVRMGPMWFVALLLIFSAGYALWRVTTQRLGLRIEAWSTPGPLAIGAFALGLAAVSFALRTKLPIGESNYGFPSLAYLPQYLSFFVLGAVAQRGDWLRSMPRPTGLFGAAAAAAVAVFAFPLAFSGDPFSLELTPALENGLGDGHWQSAVYALWDSVFSIGLVLALVVGLRSIITGASPVRLFLSAHSYAVYIVHIPIVVFTGVLLKELDADRLVKFGIGGGLAVAACFAVAAAVRRIPAVSRVV